METREKLMALQVLKDAIEAVNTATDAIDDFAEKYGMKPKEKKVDLDELAEMVADEHWCQALLNFYKRINTYRQIIASHVE